jgi:dihydrofolate reductase
MREVVVQMGVSLDGFVARPDGSLDWGLPPEHPDVTAWKLDSVRRVGTHIMGRITYQAMAAHSNQRSPIPTST